MENRKKLLECQKKICITNQTSIMQFGCHNMTALHCITGMVGTIRLYNTVMLVVETPHCDVSTMISKIIY